MSKSNLIKATGFWSNQKQDGTDYLSSGVLSDEAIDFIIANRGQAKLLIFNNIYKEKDSHPDFQMFVGLKQGAQPAQAQPQAQPQQPTLAPQPAVQATPVQTNVAPQPQAQVPPTAQPVPPVQNHNAPPF